MSLPALVLVTVTFLGLLFYGLDLAGGAGTAPDTAAKNVQGVKALRAEMGSKLPEYAYKVFGQAVSYHYGKNYRAAHREYYKLRTVPRQGGTYDLYRHSKVFQHNWNLLIKAIKSSRQ